MLKENSLEFISFSWKRFIAAILLLAVAVVNILIFGITQGRYVPTGSIMTFEGPSYFFASGLVPLIVGFLLLLYCLLSYFQGNISSDLTSLVLKEKRFKRTIETKLEKEKINRIELTNNEIGVKYLWLFLFVPYLIVNYYYMVLNFNQPFVVGLVNLTAVVILISIILSAIALAILFAFPQWYLKIYTTEGKYELWFEPYKFRASRALVKQISIALGIIEGKNEEEIKVKTLKTLSYGNLGLSAIFLGYGLFNIVAFMSTAAIYQTFLAYVLVIIGGFLLSTEIRQLPIPQEGDKVRYSIASKYYQQDIYARKVQQKSLMFLHIKFEVFWGLTTGVFFLTVTFAVVQAWMVLNPSNIQIMFIESINITIAGIGLACLMILHVLTPRPALLIKAEGYEFEASLLKNNSRKEFKMTESIRKTKDAFKRNFSDAPLKKQFVKRWIFFLIACLIGIIILLWEYFFYVNLFNIFNF